MNSAVGLISGSGVHDREAKRLGMLSVGEAVDVRVRHE